MLLEKYDVTALPFWLYQLVEKMVKSKTSKDTKERLLAGSLEDVTEYIEKNMPARKLAEYLIDRFAFREYRSRITDFSGDIGIAYTEYDEKESVQAFVNLDENRLFIEYCPDICSNPAADKKLIYDRKYFTIEDLIRYELDFLAFDNLTSKNPELYMDSYRRGELFREYIRKE